MSTIYHMLVQHHGEEHFVYYSRHITYIAIMSNQQLSDLRPPQTFITGHDQAGEEAVFIDKRPAQWTQIDDKSMGFTVPYTTSSFPVSMNDDADLTTHDKVLASGTLKLVNPGGTVCRIVDFAPGFTCSMHRTQSLDYGVVLDGEMVLILDGGEEQLMKRGDVAVQRHTNHAWRNGSETGWARMLFVLQESQPLETGGKATGGQLEGALQVFVRITRLGTL